MQILELEIFTSRLEEVRNFYAYNLDFDLIEDNAAAVSFRIGHSILKFSASQQNIHPYYHFAFLVPANKFSEAKTWLSQRVELIAKNGSDAFKFGSGNSEACYFFDIAGNIVEFIAHNDMLNTIESAFNISNIIGICEIGLPVDNVNVVRQQTEELFDLKAFDKWSINDQFTAMGDDNGLLVLVAKKRLWFPTAMPSASFRINCKIQSGKTSELIINNQYNIQCL